MMRAGIIAVLSFVSCAALSQEAPVAKEEPAKPAKPPQEEPRAQDNKAQPQKKPAMDRLDLESTSITGNSELPKVLYIVPWKKADLGDLVGRPANSLLDEVLAPVDRDVFRRQTDYFDALETSAEPAAKTESKTN